ncbi:tetratricopeptide repeat protein [Salinimonas iocasae]|uniref:Tetratricopeptide repeat protein n=1 Tax=Salinimonas iocasae TaxID=2572577 RepID=A0A5B7YEX0_9ALTE|nr:tetratricopeptide repeat protein [Salinimonas iocasae]QCZ94191.1 tetratricopeptide repeat protein [Salinimonas iocasae]
MANSNSRHELIELGKQAFNAKNYNEAVSYFSDRIKEAPKDSVTLQYLVHCYLHLGDVKEADAVLTQYSAYHATTTNYWLCKIQVAQFCQRLNDEYSAYQQLFHLEGERMQWLERYVTLCTSLHRFDEARTVLNKLIENNPVTEQKRLILWLNFYRGCERHLEALNCAKALYDTNPQSPYNLNELAVCYRLCGKSQEAVDILLSLACKKPHYAVYHNLANALSDQGKLSEAINWYKKALSLNPLYTDSHINLNKLLWESGNIDEYLTSFQNAIQAHPTAHHLSLAYADFLVDERRYADAISHLEHIEIPDYLNVAKRRIIAQAYLYAGRSSDALPILEKLTRDADTTAVDNITYGISLLNTENYPLAKEILSETIRQQPDNQLAKAYHYAATRLISDKFEGVAATVETFSYRPDDSEFWQQLIDEIMPLHASENNPLGQTLEKGTQTRGHLLRGNGKQLRKLKAFLDSSIKAYCENQRIDINTITDYDNAVNYIGSWSVRLSGQGFHHNHIHSKGKISGVIYLKLPAEIANEEAKAGWLKLGQPYLYESHELSPEMYIKPEVGKCVLFPSHAWHGTTPIHDDAERITIAFDVGQYGLDKS